GRQHGPGVGIVGVFAERAVGAAVAAEVGDRQEDLRRVRDRAAPVCVAPRTGDVEEQLGRRRVVEQRDRFGAGGGGSGSRARERGDESGTYGRVAASHGAPHWWADFGSYRRGPDLSSCGCAWTQRGIALRRLDAELVHAVLEDASRGAELRRCPGLVEVGVVERLEDEVALELVDGDAQRLPSSEDLVAQRAG